MRWQVYLRKPLEQRVERFRKAQHLENMNRAILSLLQKGLDASEQRESELTLRVEELPQVGLFLKEALYRNSRGRHYQIIKPLGKRYLKI